MKNHILKLTIAFAVIFAQVQAPATPNVNDIGEATTGNLNIQERVEVISENASVSTEKKSLFKGGDFLKRLWEWENLDKKDKVIVLNIAAIGLMTLWGLASWDYGSAKPNFHNEGWFGDKDTKFGGADKLGHMWSTFAMADLYGYLFRQWGYSTEQAAKLSALSSWVFMGVMEVMDSSSAQHGFSYEDFTMNTIGALVSYFLQLHPELDRKFDLRVEYKPKKFGGDIFTDYEHLKYILALKLSGFNQLKNSFLRYFEFHVGYYTRGYDMTPKAEDRSRNLYVGIGINVPLAIEEAGFKKTAAFLEYFQLPFTSAEVASTNLNRR
jgi:hypothetical protein